MKQYPNTDCRKVEISVTVWQGIWNFEKKESRTFPIKICPINGLLLLLYQPIISINILFSFRRFAVIGVICPPGGGLTSAGARFDPGESILDIPSPMISFLEDMGNSFTPQPLFPEFKPLGLEDREIFRQRLGDYQPETSELTFTNLFIWKDFYNFAWSLARDWLLIISDSADGRSWAFPPIGPPGRVEICAQLLKWLGEIKGIKVPSIERADSRVVAELTQASGFFIEPTRDHFDYVYGSADLVQLAGNRYQAQRNHIHHVQRAYAFAYEPLQERHLPAGQDLAEKWCAQKRCAEDLSLQGEWAAVKAALRNFQDLNLQGAVILINGQVEAFTLGELLNKDTAVIHIEKANPLISGLYAVINQEFCRHSWSQVPFINREQDLGVPGLRTAKLSYHPQHLVEKFRIRLS
jgi:hypothetical protein